MTVATTPYLDVTGYKALAVMPAATIDDVESLSPGFLAATLVERSAYINARLAKRYAVPFAAPYPEIVTGWLARLVDQRVLRKRGYVPDDASAQEVLDDAKEALEQLAEAANAVDGLFDLPLTASTSSSGISKGAPLGYSEASPFVGYDRQFSSAIDEDADGIGSGDLT